MKQSIKNKIEEKKEQIKIWWNEQGKAGAIVLGVLTIPAIITGVSGYVAGKKKGPEVTREKVQDYLENKTTAKLWINDANTRATQYLFHKDGAIDLWNYDLTKPERKEEP